MRQAAVGSLIGAFCILLLAVPAGFIWLRPELQSNSGWTVLAKLLAVDSLAALVALAVVYRLLSDWSGAVQQLERFVATLPSPEARLPEPDGAEFSVLARSLKNMADRVRSATDHAGLELTRRETILACMAEGVLAVDSNLRVIFCNAAFARAFGTRMPVPEGRIFYEVVREPILRDILERVVNTGVAETDRFQLPSAAGRWFEARALPFSPHAKSGAVIVLHDVTDIERQEQVRKDFVADVSHELRTPLASIRGYAETLLDGALEDPANNRKFVEIIEAHAIRLNNIASDLLVISELDTNAPPPVPAERIGLLPVIESAVNTVAGGASLRGIEIDTSACDPCFVFGHRFRLEQVLVNLLDNAVKFNKPDGRVTVECRCHVEGQVRISVTDTGIGIPSEDLKRVFERFYRVDKARSRPTGGTGLGLPIVKEMVQRMDGAVTVESQLNRGSTFTILLQAA